MNKLIAFTLLILSYSFYAGAKDTDTLNHSFAKAESLTIPFSDTAQILKTGVANYYNVTVSRCGVLILNLTNIPGLNVEMSVYSDTTADSLVGYSSYGGNRSLELLLSPGLYYIKVDDHFNQTSGNDYILALSFDSNDPGECDNTFYTAFPIPDSTSFTAEIRGINDLRTPVTDVDYYKVHVDRYGVLVLALANIPGLNVEMTVYSAPNVDSVVGYSGYGGNRSLELLIAPGDYYILVDDHFSQTSATPYGLTLSFDTSDVGEYDNSFYAAYPIPDNTTFNAKIRGINDLRTPVIDVDYYKVHIDRCGALLLNLTDIPGLNVEMTVYSTPNDTSSIGYSGYGGNRSLQLLVSPGDYYILVDDHFNATSATPYGLAVSFDSSNACGCNYTLATACTISDSTSFQSKIEGTSGNFVDVNYYKVSIDRCGVLVLNLANIPGLNVEMTVYEGANIDSIVGYSGYGGNRSLELLVSAGEYYIKVDDHFNATSTTPYTLTLSFDSSDAGECDNSFYEAYPISDNTTFQAKIRGINDLRTPVVDVDYYKVHINRCGALLLNLTDIPGLNVEMTVYSAPNDTSSIGYSGYGGNKSLAILVSPGDYYILVDDHFNATSPNPYTLQLIFDTSNACGCNYTLATACSIPDSTTFQSKIEGTLGSMVDVNYYKVNIDRCGVLVLNLTNIPGLNLEMTVYEGANIDSVVGYSGYGGNRSLELLVSSGEYYIKVDDHFNATSTNPYTLTLSFDSSDVGECDNSFYEAYTITDSANFQAKIRGINDLRTPIIDVDYYLVNIPLCGQLTVNLTDIGGLNLEVTAYSYSNDSMITYSGYGGNRSITLNLRPQQIYLKVDDHFNATSPDFYGLKLTFTPNPAIPIVTANGPLDFCIGQSVTLTSDSTVNNFWSSGATGKSITVTQSGIYTDTIKLSNGCASPSKPVIVEADSLPKVPVISSSGPLTFCNGLSTTLTSSDAANNYWSTGSNSQNIFVNISGAFSDTVKSNPGCYAVSDTVKVTVNPNPQVPAITPAGSVALCPSENDTLLSSSSTGNHWSNGEITAGIIIVSAGIYTDTVANNFGCSEVSAPDTVFSSPLPVPGFTSVKNNYTYTFTNTSLYGTSYLWEFGDGDTSHSVNPVHTYAGNGSETITLIVSNNCGIETATATINIATGTVEVNNATHLTITPDPCFQCELIGTVNTKDLIITDILGRTCAADYTKTANGYYINMYGYASGVFLIRDMRTGEVVKFVKE